jgi:hypothetical protein
MHSIVIHLKSRPQEWHLVEPLFYKVQASKQLLFIEFLAYENWNHVYKQIVSHLHANRIEYWQLILLNNQERNLEYPDTLTREISILKDQLLQRLADKGMAPQRNILLTLDGMKRKADYSPVIQKNYYQWQMDNFGYLKVDSSLGWNFGNAFLESEILSIDHAWGGLVNLKEAGLMDDPTESFKGELSIRRKKVEDLLADMILNKKQLSVQNHLVKDCSYYELHSYKVLETIFEEFCLQLGEMCTPPFSYHLSTFLPSNLLKTIIKENIGISSVSGEFLFIRKVISEVSPFQKIRSLLEYAFLLNAICLKPEVIERVRNGSFFEVEVLLREKEFREMYSNYYVCLQVAKEKINTRNLGQEHFMTNKYAEITALPYTTKPLEELTVEKPLFQFKGRRTFLLEWQRFLEEVEINLKKREVTSLQSAKEGVRILSFSKRQKQDHFLEEQVDIYEYSQNLRSKKNQLQADIDKVSPSLSGTRLLWSKGVTGYIGRMESLVKALPTPNILIITLLIALVSLLIPYLSTATSVDLESSNLLKYGGIPIALLGMVSLLMFYTYKSLLKPITQLVEETLSVTKELVDEQSLSHAQYNEYLNGIYQLFRIRKQFQELESKAASQKEINILYRWHQGEVHHHLTVLVQLLDALDLEIDFEKKEKAISFFQTSFDVQNNVYQNPIYSPQECQFDTFSHGHSIDVYVENSRDEIQIKSLNPLEKIRFTQDKVYSR